MKCKKYKKISDGLKKKAQNVLEMSQKYINNNFSPATYPSPIEINEKSSSLSLTLTSPKDQMCYTSMSKIP